MRVFRSVFVALLLATPVMIAASAPANALCFRKCTMINSNGACTAHTTECVEVLASVGSRLKPLRDGFTCRTQGLLCDYTGCKNVCGAPKVAAKKM